MNMMNHNILKKTANFILFGAPEVARTVKDDSANLISGKADQGVWLYWILDEY